MQLAALGFTEPQRRMLEKKGIISVEAFLKKLPLHYYDFSQPLPLLTTDPRTAAKLAGNGAFAITGMCTYFSIEQKDHMQMAKLWIKDSQTDNILFVNIMSADALKISLLEQDESHAVNNPVALPEGVEKVMAASSDLINSSCNRQIQALNEAKTVTAAALGQLKTGGLDKVSKMPVAELKSRIPGRTCEYIKSLFAPDKAASCLRWILRGLKTDLAIRKTICDGVILRDLLLNKELIVGGYINFSEQFGAWSVLNPALISPDIERNKTMNVQYSRMKGFTPSEYASYIDKAIDSISDFDIIPESVRSRVQLPSLKESARLLHHPLSWQDVKTAKKRAIFDDLLYLAIKLKLNASNAVSSQSPRMEKTKAMESYIASLPYQLTNGQKNAIDAISQKMKAGIRAYALIQGDVGTGKTCVAFALMLQAVENGYQAALAVPYTTLANQHYKDMAKVLEGTGYTAVLLTSEMTERAKKTVKEKIESGEVNIVIGTHSIFASSVTYANLGLIIEDEEHKFGTLHRENFSDKGIDGCHKITMSATPIPKSLAATIYGESSEIITITDKPADRLPVKTAITGSDEKAALEVIKQVNEGHQAYIVCPAIEKGEDGHNGASIEVKEQIYRKLFSAPGAKRPGGNYPSMAVLTGKMSAAAKNKVMESFARGETDVLMSTTVIEVGMNVPNATVMVITGADRFGFSTLHQLRGRVGRGKDQSYCILQTDQPNEKLEFMRHCTDGFEIAEKDLELRGPGSLFGERQTGDNYFVGLMLAYPKMFETVKKVAGEVCNSETGREIVRRYEEIYLAEEDR